jgi:hypothetical protein
VSQAWAEGNDLGWQWFGLCELWPIAPLEQLQHALKLVAQWQAVHREPDGGLLPTTCSMSFTRAQGHSRH